MMGVMSVMQVIGVIGGRGEKEEGEEVKRSGEVKREFILIDQALRPAA